MTTAEVAACSRTMTDVIDKLPKDLFIIDQTISMFPYPCTMNVFVSETTGCGVIGAAQMLGIAYTSVEKDGFWEQYFLLDGVKVFQQTDADK